MNFEPKVFGTGDVTLCVNAEGYQLYISQTKVACARRISVNFEQKNEGNSISVEVWLPTAHEPSVSLQIEEQIRVLKTIPWIVVHQG